jgi:class 3 adenylate cyclase/tetratricopeptide (TPR) repeat protein
MECPRCNYMNRGGAKFCDQCAAPLLRRGSLQPYTPPHLTEAVLTSRSVLEGERKLVTVVFCDIANSTLLAERLGADVMHALLDRFFSVALDVVHRHEGTINQFLGDGFMALFGAPLAQEQHARQGVLASLALVRAIRERLAELREARGLQLAVRVGINTGPVVVGKIGDNLRMDYTAVGDTTNVAARLQQLAEPNAILISQTTFRAIRDQFEVEALGRRHLKGKSETVPIYRVKGTQDRTGGERRLGAALIGRDREAQTLRACINQIQHGRGGVVCVVGESGIGKSRLLAEAHRETASTDLLWLEGRCLPFTGTLSYSPFIEILRRYAGITDADTGTSAWGKLQVRLGALFGEYAADMAPYLAALLGVGMPGDLQSRPRYLDAAAIGRQILLTSRRFFEGLAREHRVILVFEDLHWVDDSSAELLQHLAPLVANVPLLVCLVMRPESAGPAQAVRTFCADCCKERYTEIPLAPLSPIESQGLIADLLQAAPSPALHQLVLAKAEGNPFFIEEVIRTLIALGAIARDEASGAWSPTPRFDQVTIPDTVQGVIMARIDRLDDGLKQVLKLAAVIGRTFLYRILNAIAVVERKLEEDLVELQNVELVRERRRLPELEYVFKHALVQEAAYESILLERRRQLHRRVGEAIEALFGGRLNDFTVVLAYHYARAEDWEKAKDYLRQAGDQAGEMAGDAEALAHYGQAFMACERLFGEQWPPTDRALLERKMGEAFFRQGDHHQAADYLRKALTDLGHPLPTSRWGVRAAIVLEVLRQLWHRVVGVASARSEAGASEAIERTRTYEVMAWIDFFMDQERALLNALLFLNLSEAHGLRVNGVRGLTALGMVCDLQRLSRLAAVYHARAVRLAETEQHPVAIGFAQLGDGLHEYQLGRARAAYDRFARSASAYREAGDVHAWGGAATMKAWVLRFVGDFSSSRTISEEIVRVGEETRDDQVRAWGLHGLGWTLWHLGALEEAAAHLKKAIELYQGIPDYPALAEATADLAQCELRQGRLTDALSALVESNRVIADRTLRGVVCTRPRLALAEARLLALEETAGGAAERRLASHAVRTALDHSHTDRLARPAAYRLIGTFSWLVNKRSAAESWWRRAVSAAEEMEARYELARTQLEFGRRLREHDRLSRAEAIFAELGARHDLARTRQAFLEIRSALPVVKVR